MAEMLENVEVISQPETKQNCIQLGDKTAARQTHTREDQVDAGICIWENYIYSVSSFFSLPTRRNRQDFLTIIKMEIASVHWLRKRGERRNIVREKDSSCMQIMRVPTFQRAVGRKGNWARIATVTQAGGLL